MKRLNCYIYTRVSTSMQVEGFSLDAQREKLRKYAEYQEMHIAGEYSDEGKSGKNIGGRLEFQRMLSDIASGKDSIDYVLVFKLSRFGRNAADVLSSLQIMQDYGANLICVEDGIDSSKDSGKLMISVLSAVAEIERENILVQTMEGRKQKAREGKWNGGFAPYGYYLEKGELKIAEDEAETIRIIFDKYINTNMGANGIAKYLNQHGIAKKPRQNGTLNTFSAHFIKLVIQNPVYCGKIAFGRRKTEKINGTRNEYHIVKQEQYPIYDGIHEAIVSVEDWELAQQKRKKLGVKREKIYNLDHEHLLSGLLRCPVCGAAMYGNINRKKKPDGTIYKDHFYYACKHRMRVDGHKCDYHRQWNQTVINGAVEEVIERLVSNPEFEKALCEKINTRVSTEGLEEELTVFKKQLNQLVMSKRKLASQMDSLDVTDRHYDKKYQDMQNRLYDFYDEIEVVEEQITELQSRIANIKEEKISGENVYLFLHYYGTMYKEFTDAEKKKFLNTFIESVEIFKEEQPNGRLLKCINFKFPVFYDGDENVTHIRWDSETTVEMVIPATYNGKAVTSIGEYAFYDCTSLTSITISDSVTSIGYGAFYGCTGLTDVSMGNGTISIGTCAFYKCTGLTSITIPDSVTSIGYKAFEDCTGLTSIIIPDSVTEIDQDAFRYCTGLESITIDNASTVIHSYAFADCTGLTDVSMGNGTISIGTYAFYKCIGLTSITIPDSVTSIDSSAFYGCIALTSITLPFVGESLNGTSNTHFGYIFGADSSYSNYNCVPASLKEVTITAPCETIGYSAFSDCTGLTSITIPDSVTSIGSSAFEGCTGLTSITIPDSVTSIGGCAFRGCTGLTSITIPDCVTSIDYYAFSGCTSLTSITIPDSVTSIGNSAFYGCTGLTSITLPFVGASLNGTSDFGYIFRAYDSSDNNGYVPASLKEVTITAPCEKICSYAFSGCTSLTSITIPDSVTSIGKDAFNDTGYYNNLSNWENRVLYIGNHLIKAMTNTTFCDIRQGTKTIAGGAFEGCTGLTSITIPDSVTSIGSSAFEGCTGLTSITIPDSVTSIGSYAFQNCTRLTSITIPDSVTSIGSSAFYGCTRLTSITLPFVGKSLNGTSNTHFGYIFGASTYSYNNSYVPAKLKEVTITAPCETIGSSAFEGCTGLTSITIPATLTNVEKNAFNCRNLNYVFYGGTEQQKENITISIDGNDRLIFDAVWHYQSTGHSYGSYTTTVNSTCTANGSKQRTCSVCKYVETATIAKTAHKYNAATCTAPKTCTVCKATSGKANGHNSKTTIPAVAATYTSEGKTAGKKCSVCEEVTVKQTPIPKLTLGKVTGLKAKKVKAAKSSEITLVWDKIGDGVKYEVYVKNGKKWTKLTTTSKTSYTVKKDGKKKKLKADAEYQFKVRAVVDGVNGAYSSVLKVETIPETTSKLTLKAGKKQLTATWSKVSDISGYEIQYSTSKKFTKKTTKIATAKKSAKKTTIKKLTKGKKYYVRVRTYKTVDGKKIYSGWSTVKNVKVK